MSIATICPPLTMTAPIENGCPFRKETTPATPLISAGLATNPKSA
jgi:hypothetical protein